MKKTIYIDGMSCGHCTARVKAALEQLNGVSSVEVELEAKRAVVETDGSVADNAIRDAVDEAGYDVATIE